jgi:hypothetical protein
MDDGKLVAQGTIAELLVPRSPTDLQLVLDGDAAALAAARLAAEAAGARVVSLGGKRPDLEQVFLELTGKTLRDD